MRSLFKFFLKYYAFFLFLALEIVSFSLVVQFNNYQRVRFLNSSNSVMGKTLSIIDKGRSYFQLSKQNSQLADENAKLYEQLLVGYSSKNEPLVNFYYEDSILPDSISVSDSISDSIEVTPLKEVQTPIPTSKSFTSDEMPTITTNERIPYSYIAAKVISNTVNKQFNYITINKGLVDGIRTDMGVVGGNGIVGVVIGVSEHYATVLSALHLKWATNAKLLKSNHAGILRWEGNDPKIARLDNIPYHVEVEEDDMVVTSGFSSFFPQGILIGKVIKVEHDGANNFQQIKVEFSTDFSSLYYVYVINNRDQKEILNLQNSIPDGE